MGKDLTRTQKIHIFKTNDSLRFAFSTPYVYNLFLDKAAFNKRFSKYVKRGWIATDSHSWSDIESFVDKYDSVIAKPLTDYGGHGVFKIDKNKSDYIEQKAILKRLVEINKKYIVEETIHNCEVLKNIAPDSLNTLRFVTVIDKDKNLHIVASLLRMGNGIGITDNYHDGGLACAIDLNTGMLKGVAFGMNCVSYEVHPFSKVKFDAFKIPNYHKCIEFVKKIVYVEPDARYVGWDIAITDNGIELLEGNIPPGEDITQIATGFGLWNQMLEWK